ncbi:MAG: TldD/PmbA family protein [Candidatus Hydrothermia bacterium]
MIEKFREIAKKIIQSSKADHTEVFFQRVKEDNTRFGESRVTQNMSMDQTSLSVTVHVGKKKGTLTTTLGDDIRVEEILRRAVEIAQNNVEDPEYMPPVEKEDIPVIMRVVPDTESVDPKTKAGVLGSIFNDARRENLRVAGIFTNGVYQYGIFNTNGLEAYYETSMASLSTTVQTENSSGYAKDQNEDIGKIKPLDIYAVAKEKAIKGMNPKDLEPGFYDVILEPLAVADFVDFMLFDMDARGADEGRSFFSGKHGQKIFDERVTLYSDPFSELNPSMPFDNEGVAIKKINWVKSGVLENLYYDRYWAKKNNKKPTGRPFSLIFADTEKSMDELIKKVKRGLLITRFWYIRYVDRKSITLTGMTRDGLFYIEDGIMRYPVKNFRFNDSPARALANVIDIGKGRRIVGEEISFATYMPTLLIKDFNLASKTEF